jgi:hypothetical protein
MTRTLRPLAALAMASLLSAGCSKTPAHTDTGSTGATAGTTATRSADKRAQGVKFAECVREHGVPDFPDPNASGDSEYGVSVTPEVWTKAVGACKDLQPAGTLSAKLNPEQQSAALKFAQCIRDNGVPDFPDPVSGEPLVDTNRIPSSNRPGGMTILNATMHKCGGLLKDTAAGR